MINLRYHIVSITAVFLALGIGLAFGASFIDRATVDTLENNLNEIEQQNQDLEAANRELGDRIDAAEALEAGLREQALAQLVEGRLAEVPVLLLADDATDDEVVADTEAVLVASGAQLAGIVRVTDRFVLDDQSEVDDLRAVLGLPSATAPQLLVAVTRQVATILRAAAQPSTGDDDDGVSTPVPPLLDGLLAGGFLELEPADTPPSGFALVPDSDLRVVVVTGGEATADPFLGAVLRRSAAIAQTDPAAPPPVLVAAHATRPAPAEGEEEAPAPTLVELLRAEEGVRDRLSTVDDLDSFAGLAAVVLAVAHGIDGQTGHYGMQDDAQSLLPPALVPPADG